MHLVVFSGLSMVLLEFQHLIRNQTTVSRFHDEVAPDVSALSSGLCITTIFQFFILPRRRRLFFVVSVICNMANIIGAVLITSKMIDTNPFLAHDVSLVLKKFFFHLYNFLLSAHIFTFIFYQFGKKFGF